MKWVNGLTLEAKIELKQTWHVWFAWYPVVVDVVDGHSVKVWLEEVERKGAIIAWADRLEFQWEYRTRRSLRKEGE